MLEISPLKLLVAATILGVVLTVSATIVLVAVQAPDTLKNLIPLVGVLPPLFAGLLKLFNRIDQIERATVQRARNADAKADLAIRKADQAIHVAEKGKD